MKNILLLLVALWLLPSLATAQIKGVYETLAGPAPKAHSLKQVTVREFFAFHCPHCYHFSKEIPALKKRFGKKLKIIYTPIDWVGADPPKLYYIAQEKGKEEAVAAMMYDFIHEKGLGETLYQDRFKLAYVAKLNGLTEEFKQQIDSPEIAAKFKAGTDLARSKGVDSTPTFIVEGVYKVQGGPDNLALVINSLLKAPVK